MAMGSSIARGLAGVVVGVTGLAGVLGVGGCTRDDPSFRTSDLVAAPGVVGTWSGTGGKGEAMVLTVTEAPQPTADGRVMARLTSGQAQNGATGSATVYAFHLESTTPANAGAAAPAPDVIEARVYLLKGALGGDGTMIGCCQFEPISGEPVTDERQMFGVRFDAHLMLGVRLQPGGDREGGAAGAQDRLSILMPVAPVSLAPTVKLLDPPALASPDAPAPAMEAALRPGADGKAAGGLLLTNDPDRALGVYRRYGASAGFWQKDRIEFKRVR